MHFFCKYGDSEILAKILEFMKETQYRYLENVRKFVGRISKLTAIKMDFPASTHIRRFDNLLLIFLLIRNIFTRSVVAFSTCHHVWQMTKLYRIMSTVSYTFKVLGALPLLFIQTTKREHSQRDC